MTVDSLKKQILDRAAADPEFRAKVIRLGALGDQMTYPNPFAEMPFASHFLEFARDAGRLEKGLTQESLSELYQSVMETANEWAYYAAPMERLAPSRRYRRPVGKVFLSW